MVDHDWKTPAKDLDDFWARQEALADVDVLDLLEADPRDKVLSDLLYYHPQPLPVRAQISGAIELQAVLTQLIIADLISAGLVERIPEAALRMSESGLLFAKARLTDPDMNSIYRVREDAPPYGPLSVEAAIALKYLILTSSSHVETLLTDIYHPALGPVIFD